jgi:hypothetical protein
MSLSDDLAAYFRSGNDVAVERAHVPAELAHRIVAELRRFEHVLESDICDLFHYGGDADEIRDGIDYAMANPECECAHEPTPMEEETRRCGTCGNRIVV